MSESYKDYVFYGALLCIAVLAIMIKPGKKEITFVVSAKPFLNDKNDLEFNIQHNDRNLQISISGYLPFDIRYAYIERGKGMEECKDLFAKSYLYYSKYCEAMNVIRIAKFDDENLEILKGLLINKYTRENFSGNELIIVLKDLLAYSAK